MTETVVAAKFIDPAGVGRSGAGGRIDVVSIVDASPTGAFILGVVALCAGVSFLDGFDILAISYVAPVIGKAWALPKEAFGPIFAAHYVGASLGSVFFGWYADRYGRRMGVIVPTAIFGVFALLTVFAYDFRSLLLLRALIGVGLGGALSNAIAMVAEYSPHRARATLVSLMYAAFPLGGVLGGPLSAFLIPRYGWQSVFVVGGVLPLLLMLALVLWLNESIRFLVLSRAPADRIGSLLHRISPAFRYAAGDEFILGQKQDISTRPTREIFSREHVRATVLLCLAAFTAQLVIVYVVTWMPLVLASIGMPVTSAILASVAFSVGGIVGAIGLARLIDRYKSYGWLIATFFASAAAIAGIGFLAADWYALLAITAVTGLLTVGANIVLSAYSATVYPTSIRSTGVGWVVGWGRVGAIAGALFGTALVAIGLTIESAYMIAAVPAVVGGLAVAFVRARHHSNA
ncbi:MAG TPA: MFS transporter [Xanthobacteraceae bacterium]|nr:MFS transporter [Xanthobacteraceae bacterium]